MQTQIKQFLNDSSNTMLQMAEGDVAEKLQQSIEAVVTCFKQHHKILICGNGGSAADAQHFAAEFVNRYKLQRPPLPAIALTTDSSILTSIGNDSSFDEVFSKQVEAFGEPGDLFFIMTTSDVSFAAHGHSANLGLALKAAREKNMKIIGLVSQKSRDILEHIDIPLIVPHRDTPRIQEAHITMLHIICELAETQIFST
jgi:D-sedoheptulose 7-phosphate isomerase